MVDIKCTLIQNILDRTKRLSLQGEFNSTAWRQILSLIAVTDMIKWVETLDDASDLETRLVKLRDDLLLCYSDNLKLCRDYNSADTQVFTSTNIPNHTPMWDRVWDNSSNRIDPSGFIIPEEQHGLIFAGIKDL